MELAVMPDRCGAFDSHCNHPSAPCWRPGVAGFLQQPPTIAHRLQWTHRGIEPIGDKSFDNSQERTPGRPSPAPRVEGWPNKESTDELRPCRCAERPVRAQRV